MANKIESTTVYRFNTPVFGIADWSDMGHKKPVLWIQNGENCRVKVASFNNEMAARMFSDLIVRLLEKGDGDEKS